METHSTKNKNFFDAFEPKQAFWLGFVAAVLAIGTLGFIILGSCVLKGSCAVEGIAITDQDEAEADSVVADDTSDTGTTAVVPAVSDTDHIRGDENAPITIIEYSDYQCSYCGRFHPTMLDILDEYDGDVRWVYRHFPLSFHPEAGPAALAAECAGEQGKFWEFTDEMFENQASLGDDFYAQTAADLGLNTSDWQDCYDSEKYADMISTDATDGAKAGVTGTPGSFIIDQDGNAIPIKGALPFETISAAIDELLK